jgi:ring-1,2-phenylacetyl-CoA epoxidase subunit PaaA
MYAQMVDTGVKAVATTADMSLEERAFQAHRRRQDRPRTDARAYRKTLVRQVSQHAHSEIVGMLPGATDHARRRLRARRSDGESSGRGRPRSLPVRGGGTLGVCATGWSRTCRTRQVFEHQYPTLTWADVGDRLSSTARRS